MNIQDYLRKRAVPFEVLPHEWTRGASKLAHAVHVPGAHVAKTVLLHANHGYCDVVAVVPANSRINLELAGKMLGRAEIKLGNEQDVAVRCPDCERGVLPPFGSEYGMQTIVDRSLALSDDIVFEGNTHVEAIRVKWQDYNRIENPLIGTIAELQ